jgi:serine/threonine protein kinase
MPLAVGQTLTHYKVLGPLGAGAMGEVYRARDTRLEREVALKVLPENLAGDEERLRRFEREAKALASLNHPNVAQVFGIDQVGDTSFMAMELVPGRTSPRGCRAGLCPSTKRSTSAARSPRGSRPLTKRA